MTDEEILSGCASRDKRSWDIFVERYAKLVYWSIRKTLSDSPFTARTHLVQDIFQEVFAKLLDDRVLVKLKTVGNVKGFLAVMACHSTLDKIKHLSRNEFRSVQAESGSLFSSQDPSFLAVTAEREALLSEALEGLSEKERSCIELHYLEGRKHHEIADRLGMPQDTVSTIIRRTKEKVRVSLENRGLEG